MSFIPSKLLALPDDKIIFKDTLIQWLIIVGLMFLFIESDNSFLMSILLLLIAGRYHALGIILHDISHQNLNAPKSIYRQLTIILTGYILSSSAESMSYHHMRHHQNSNTNLDPYFHINKNKRSKLASSFIVFLHGPIFMFSWILRTLITPLVLLCPSLKPYYAKYLLQHVDGTNLNFKEIDQCLKNDLPIFFFQVLLIIISYKFPIVFMLTYLPVCMTGVLCIWRLYSEHHYDLQDTTHFENIIRTTFDHHMSTLDSLLFAPLNIGFHKVHHLHPRVAYYQLPKIREWYKINHPGYGE